MDQGFRFVHNERLGIKIPVLDREWYEYAKAEQEAMILQWEVIRSRIPDRIQELEAEINLLQAEASQEDDWDRVCELYEQLYTIASVINDLNIWHKNDPDTASRDEMEPEIAIEHQSRETN